MLVLPSPSGIADAPARASGGVPRGTRPGVGAAAQYRLGDPGPLPVE